MPDVIWEAFVEALLPLGAVEERPSRYADKPALVLRTREIAHSEASGVIDLRITQAGWRTLKAQFADDPAVRHDPRRRDWIELRLGSTAEFDRLRPLLERAVSANR